MAFSKTPENSTYVTKEIQLLNTWESRDPTATKDNETLNCFFEKVMDKTTGENDSYVVKRDGHSLYGYTCPSTNVRGYHYWEDQDRLLIAYDNVIDTIVASTGALVATSAALWANTTTSVGFTEFYYTSTATKVVVTDGTTLYTIDTSFVFTVCASPDLPSPHLPYPIFLDGYLFLAKTGTADLFNSNLDDPLLWTAGDFISAEMFPDKLVMVTKQNNYIVAFGSFSIEYFWNAGIATGSPLQRYDTPVKFVGYLGGLATYDNKLYFVGNTTNSVPTVYEVDDLKLKEISAPVLRRYFQDNTTFNGCFISNGGHDFYLITSGTFSYCFDIGMNKWYRWSYGSGASFPAIQSVMIPTASYGNASVFNVDGTATFVAVNPLAYQDNTVAFTARVITDNEMFDTLQRKTINKMLVHADRPTTDADLSISVSDNDYQSWSTARTVNLNQEWPMLSRWGQFRRRAHKLEYTANTPLRLYKLEVEVNMGQS